MRLESLEHEAPGGVFLSFDDDYLVEWHAQRELLREFGARATFFVRGLDRLSDRELRLLHDLKADGHEIGSHSYRHRSVMRHYGGNPEKIGDYLREEVIPAAESMRAAGLEPRSFAFPYGHHTPEYDAAVLEHFGHVRGTAYKRRFVAPHRLRAIYHRMGSGERVHHALGIDNVYSNQVHLTAALRKAATQRLVLGLYAHRLAEDDEQYTLRPSKLRELLALARTLSLRCFVVSELE